MYENYVGYIREEHYIEPYGIHGISHVKRVLFLADKIASHYSLTDKEKKILALACCYHDIGRIHNDWDEAHGRLSSEKVVELNLLDCHGLQEDDKKLILELIEKHCVNDSYFKGNKRKLLLYNILKDSDGLDRVRIFDLDPYYLRLPESLELIEMAWQLLLTNQLN